MKRIQIVILIGWMVNIGLYTIAQELPDLRDHVLVCEDGAFPFYMNCEGATCVEVYYYPNGNRMTAGNCSDGKKAGMWTSYCENGNVKSKGVIKDGKLHGKWSFYHEKGNKLAEGEFTAGQFELGCTGSGSYRAVTVMNGQWTFWNEDGGLNISCHFAPNNYQEETLNGAYTWWYSNGQKRVEGVYQNGMMNGKWAYWYENGKKQKEEFYVYKDCGLYDYIWYECPSGTWTYWDEKGGLLKKEVYEEGVRLE